MIKIRIKNADHEIDIRFPISESELFAKLGEIHAVEGRDAAQSALVTEVYWPEEFSMLKDRYGIRNCEDAEDFNNLLRGLGQDAMDNAWLPDDEEGMVLS